MKVEILYENCETRMVNVENVKVSGITEAVNLADGNIDRYYCAEGGGLYFNLKNMSKSLMQELENKEIAAIIVPSFDSARPIYFSGAKQYSQVGAGMYIVVME